MQPDFIPEVNGLKSFLKIFQCVLRLEPYLQSLYDSLNEEFLAFLGVCSRCLSPASPSP